ncbi:MAG: sigma-70 family RNA polymerase sigma factor [Gemmataceae bacterium]|nr:sigma-70 family RNA polymerase sigma factor [Gemmataceae bacterium]
MPATDGLGLDFHARLLRVARHRGPSATAEDRVQDVWLDVLAKGVPEDVAGTPGRLRAWLCGVLHHKIRDASRRDRRATTGPPDRAEPAAVGGDPAAELIRDETAAAVRRTVASIAGGRGQECARCLALRYLDGLSLAEVAAATGSTVAQVKARLQRAKRRFRRAWGGGG